MVHLYIGDGKGKTTAALGLALRAVGFGKKVYVAQFLKDKRFPSGVMHASSCVDLPLKIERFSPQVHPLFSKGTKVQKENVRQSTESALNKVELFIQKKKYDVIVLDEVLNSLSARLCTKQRLKALIAKAHDIELILTGRTAPLDFIKAADYVSEIKKVKHPFDKGVKAREGIEY